MVGFEGLKEGDSQHQTGTDDASSFRHRAIVWCDVWRTTNSVAAQPSTVMPGKLSGLLVQSTLGVVCP
jgi:hypothetical protein